MLRFSTPTQEYGQFPIYGCSIAGILATTATFHAMELK